MANKTDFIELAVLAFKREALKKLNERERKIIDLRFFAGKTQSEIAGYIGISQAQVSRIEKKAIESLKELMA